MRTSVLGIASGLLVLGIGSHAALANSPAVNGLWSITFYLEPDRSTGATQCINFVVTNAIGGITNRSGTWSSSTATGWGGQWIQEGDHVRFWGIVGSLSTEEAGNMENASHIGGEAFTHFGSSDGSISTAGSFIMVKDSNCSAPTKPRHGDPAQRQ